MWRATPLGLLAACAGGATTDTGTPGAAQWELRSHVDEGAPCLHSDGATITVFVVLDDCLSGSCSRALTGTCEAALVNDATIAVTSTITWEENVTPGADCSSDCGIPMATCSMPEVPAGTYTVTLGADSFEVTLPRTEECQFL